MRTRILGLFPNVDIRARLLKTLAESDLGQRLLRPFPPLIPLCEVKEGVSRTEQLSLAKELRRGLQRAGEVLTMEQPEIRLLDLGWGEIPWVISPLKPPLTALDAMTQHLQGSKKPGLDSPYALLGPLSNGAPQDQAPQGSMGFGTGPIVPLDQLFPLDISAAYLANIAINGSQEEEGGTSLFWEMGSPAWLPSGRQLNGGEARRPRSD